MNTQSTAPSILIVDDMADNRLLLKLQLNHLASQTWEASNGLEAVKMAQLHQPDFILMDVNMPMMDGIEATQRIRCSKKSYDPIIIGITAINDFLADAIDLGFDTILAKPYDPRLLKQLITSGSHTLAQSS